MFKEKEKFVTMIRNFNVTKSTIFKTTILKLVNKYPKLIKPWLFLNFFKKMYVKEIKEICKENAEEFI